MCWNGGWTEQIEHKFHAREVEIIIEERKFEFKDKNKLIMECAVEHEEDIKKH